MTPSSGRVSRSLLQLLHGNIISRALLFSGPSRDLARVTGGTLASIHLLGFLIRLQTQVHDTLHSVHGGARLCLYAEHGGNRRAQQVLVDIGGILSTRDEAHHQTHQHSQHATDRAVPQVTRLKGTDFTWYRCECNLRTYKSTLIRSPRDVEDNTRSFSRTGRRTDSSNLCAEHEGLTLYTDKTSSSEWCSGCSRVLNATMVWFMQGHPSTDVGLLSNRICPFIVATWAPNPIHKTTVKLVIAPTIAPLALAHGTNMPKENSPRVTPPTMPLKDNATWGRWIRNNSE